MTDTAYFYAQFESSKTISDANRVYTQLYGEYITEADRDDRDSLWEAHRRTLVRITEGGTPDEPKEVDHDRVRPKLLRNWCMRQGIGLARKGRVPAEIENQYREAHGLDPIPVAPTPVSLLDLAVSPGVVRAWARDQGIEVGSRGRVNPDVIAAFAEAHSEEAS